MRNLFLVLAFYILVFAGCETGDLFSPDVIACFDYSPNNVTLEWDSIYFTSCSENATSFEWWDGESFFSSEENPTYFPTSTGSHRITLVAYNDKGVDSISRQINISWPPNYIQMGNSVREVGDIWAVEDPEWQPVNGEMLKKTSILISTGSLTEPANQEDLQNQFNSSPEDLKILLVITSRDGIADINCSRDQSGYTSDCHTFEVQYSDGRVFNAGDAIVEGSSKIRFVDWVNDVEVSFDGEIPTIYNNEERESTVIFYRENSSDNPIEFPLSWGFYESIDRYWTYYMGEHIDSTGRYHRLRLLPETITVFEDNYCVYEDYGFFLEIDFITDRSHIKNIIGEFTTPQEYPLKADEAPDYSWVYLMGINRSFDCNESFPFLDVKEINEFTIGIEGNNYEISIEGSGEYALNVLTTVNGTFNIYYKGPLESR